MEQVSDTIMEIRFDIEVDRAFIQKYEFIDIPSTYNDKVKQIQEYIFDKTGIEIKRDVSLKDNDFIFGVWCVSSGITRKNYYCIALSIRQYEHQFEAIKNDLCMKILDIAASYGIDESTIAELKRRYL